MADPYRNPGRCPDHRGSPVAGCTPCRAWWAWERRTRLRAKREGTFTAGRVDPAKTAARLAELTRAGMSLAQIAEAAGLCRRNLHDIANGVPTYVLAETEAAVIGVRLAPGRWIDGTGTRRRLQALAAIGYPLWALGDLLNVNSARAHVLATRESRRVTPAMADRVAAVYDRFSMTPGPSAPAARRAARNGWAPPLAWDETTIDDPAAQPAGLRAPAQEEKRNRDELDPIRVERAVAGELPAAGLTRAERVAAIEALSRPPNSMSDKVIARHLRWTGADPWAAVTAFRRRYGIAPALPAPHDGSHKRKPVELVDQADAVEVAPPVEVVDLSDLVEAA